MSIAEQAQQQPPSVEAVNDRATWLKDRKSAIGASDVAAILGMSPWASAWDVWADKTGRLEDWKGNEATRAGQLFEAAVLDHAEKDLGKLTRNVRVIHPRLPVAATLDAQVEHGGSPVEAKTTGIVGKVYGDWGEALTDQVPDYYLVQVHTQLLVTGAELGFLFALIAGRGVVKYQIERSQKTCDAIEVICNDWWERHVVAGKEPAMKAPPALDVVRRMRRQPGKTVVFGEDMQAVFAKRCELKEQEKAIKDELEAVDASILHAMGDAEGATLPDGTQLTYLERSRKGYVVEPAKFRQMQVIKPKQKKAPK